MKKERTASDVYRDLGRLVDELVELKTPFAQISNNLGKESGLPDDVARRIAQVVTSKVQQQCAAAAGR